MNRLNIRLAIARYPMLTPLIAFVLYNSQENMTYEKVGDILGITKQGAKYVIDKFKEEAEIDDVTKKEIVL